MIDHVVMISLPRRGRRRACSFRPSSAPCGHAHACSHTPLSASACLRCSGEQASLCGGCGAAVGRRALLRRSAQWRSWRGRSDICAPLPAPPPARPRRSHPRRHFRLPPASHHIDSHSRPRPHGRGIARHALTGGGVHLARVMAGSGQADAAPRSLVGRPWAADCASTGNRPS